MDAETTRAIEEAIETAKAGTDPDPAEVERDVHTVAA